jgi:hypothetical protein
VGCSIRCTYLSVVASLAWPAEKIRDLLGTEVVDRLVANVMAAIHEAALPPVEIEDEE